jgi:glycosyltransferase involved in cell wall biosynthesis
VLYINGWSSCHGGSSTSLLDIVAALDKSRYEPLVLCPEEGPLPDRLQEIGIPCMTRRMTPLTRRGIARFAWEVPGYMRFLKKHRIDLIHANTGCWRRSVALAAKWASVPFVQHVRNPITDHESDFSLDYASRIITNSNQVGDGLRGNPKYGNRVVTIYNAVDLSQYESDDDRREEIGAADRPLVGFVGQIVPRKGVTTLLRAMPRVLQVVPNALLAVVGCSPPSDDSYEGECRQLIESLKIADHVRFTGYRRDVPAWMRSFDVFALPTRSEPFGKVVIEAMAAGCPVVASAVGGIPEIIENPRLGTLIEPDDVDALAEAIVAYLSDRKRAAEVAALARTHVQQRFSLATMAARLQELYDQILAQTSASFAEIR